MVGRHYLGTVGAIISGRGVQVAPPLRGLIGGAHFQAEPYAKKQIRPAFSKTQAFQADFFRLFNGLRRINRLLCMQFSV
jgi:hypothetical protein